MGNNMNPEQEMNTIMEGAMKELGKVSKDEYNYYWDMLEKKYNRKLEKLIVIVDGDFVDLKYKFAPVTFERIRRITGYLTPTSTWNDAKRAELQDRKKHDL